MEGWREGGRKEGREGGPISMEGRAPICISTIRLQIGHLFDEYMHYLHCALTSKHCTCIPFYIYIHSLSVASTTVGCKLSM